MKWKRGTCMDLKQTLNFIESNKSKRILTGQTNIDSWSKLYHFAWVAIFCIGTCGAGFVLLLFMKKNHFHPDIYIKDTNNPIVPEKTVEFVKNAGYELSGEEDPLVLINVYKKQFLLFTSKHVYYTLANSQKILDSKITSGRLPLNAAKDIKTKKSMSYSLAVMMDDEIIGALDVAEDKRITGLLNEFSKDVREQV